MAMNLSEHVLLPPQSEYPLPWTADEHVQSALTLLKERLFSCPTVQQCSLMWFLLVWMYRNKLPMKSTENAWYSVYEHFTRRLEALQGRSALLRRARSLIRESLRRELKEPADLAAAERDATLLIYADSEAYLKKPHVKPFVRHLRCYAEARGMGFTVTHVGLPQDVTTWGEVGDDGAHMQGWYFSTRGPAAQDAELGRLLSDIIQRPGGAHKSAEPYRRLPELLRHRHMRHVRVQWMNALIWGAIWGIEARLLEMKLGALLIFYNVDVTIRPDGWHHSLAQLLLNRSASRPFAVSRAGTSGHVFIADSWRGAECVNGGFVAFRNTPVARHFLRAWRAKMEVAGSWDQGALGETVLEFVGMEVSTLSKGKLRYDHRCLQHDTAGDPSMQGIKTWAMYCDCYHDTLEELIGPYRRRASGIVSFVDPDVAAVNFVPQNLFVDHNDVLEGTRLVPWRARYCGRDCREGFMPPLKPLVIHWAGIGLARRRLMKEYLRQAFNISANGCPRVAPVAQGGMGTNARQIRCCEFFLRYSHEPRGLDHERWWGCHEFPQSVREEECDEYQYGPASAGAVA